jgi:hypothetical protein
MLTNAEAPHNAAARAAKPILIHDALIGMLLG